MQGLVGGLSARQGGSSTDWRLRLGNLVLEQRYPYGGVLVTAGALLSFAQMEGFLQEDGLGRLTRFEGQTFGGGLVAGARWPRQTRLGFMARAGYEWLPVTGAWRGAGPTDRLATALDLGGLLLQGQLELSF